MKKQMLLLTIIIVQLSIGGALAQNGSRLESIKVAYLSEKLNLDTKTAERFWPIYNQYDEEIHQLVQERKRSNDTRSVEEILDQEQRAIDIKRKYSVLFQKVISAEQLKQLFKSEKEFNLMLLRRRNKMENRKERMEDNGHQRDMETPRMNQRPRDEHRNDRMPDSRPPSGMNPDNTPQQRRSR